MNARMFRGAAAPILLIALVVLFFVSQRDSGADADANNYPKLYEQIEQGRIERIEVHGDKSKIEVTPKKDADDNEPYTLGYGSSLVELEELYRRLEENDQLDVYHPQPIEGGGLAGYFLTGIFPILLLLVGFYLIYRFMAGGAGGGKGVLSFGKSRARQLSPDAPKVTFKDVAGADEAVEELEEIRDFLENPRKFEALGARIPKGVLLFGPPGTGKTLLARAVAGEAGVPFFSISGSDFVEMFVGVGASRVRDLFEQAKQQSPCIVFVDEIDAVGRHRGAGMGGGNDEREQTLNQLLVEMDGFEMKDNIIVIAATNRPDILDPALLRPGRFDRQIRVDAPDREGRKAILGVHTKGKPLAKDVNADRIAGQTAGFTGADLENLVNEAALLAARHGHKHITTTDLEEGIMRVIVGPEKKGRVMSEREKRVTAVHEMGHALCAHYLEHADPVHKISVVGRGMALGYVVSMPAEDRYTQRRVELMATLAQALGGRAAEEIVFGEFTTGAANDLQKVTELAKRMIMRWGMSDRLGPRAFGHDSSQPFLGRDFQTEPDYSDDLAKEIDAEIHRVIEEAHEMARSVLNEHRDELERLADILVEHETIDSDQFEQLLAGADTADVFADADTAASDKPAADHKPAAKPRSASSPGTLRPRPGGEA